MARVFPAYVGMSPWHTCAPRFILSVPRIRGDEPWRNGVGRGPSMCSPHTWG